MGKIVDLVNTIIERGRDTDEAMEILHNAICDIKHLNPALYNDTMTKLEAIAYRISPEEAERIVRSMKPFGQKWDYNTIKAYLAPKGIRESVCHYYMVMNMYYNDSRTTAEMVGRAEDPDFYFSLARDFIEDVDGHPLKVERYFAT